MDYEIFNENIKAGYKGTLKAVTPNKVEIEKNIANWDKAIAHIKEELKKHNTKARRNELFRDLRTAKTTREVYERISWEVK